jgi:large subunit ribosomal protein L6
MSRLGKLAIILPAGVSVSFVDNILTVKGPKGELKREIKKPVLLTINEKEILVSVEDTSAPKQRAFWGLFRGLINNMVTGVSVGFAKKLEINGVGYRASVAGRTLNLSLGYSHPIVFALPEGIDAIVEGNAITISGISNELVGNTAYKIRKFRKPEPYKGKGVKYSTEVIRRKAGKSAAKGK